MTLYYCSTILSKEKHFRFKCYVYHESLLAFPTEMVHNLYGISIHFVLNIHFSALPSIWLQKSKKSWKTAQAVESIVTSDSSTSCQLHATCLSALHKDIPQKQLWGTPEHMVSQWNPDQPRGLCRATTVVSWNSTDSLDVHFRLCWLLPRPALLSVEQFQLTFRWISGIQIQDNNSSIKAETCPY